MVLDLEGFTKLLSLGFALVYPGVGLTFVNKFLNMVTIYFFSLCNLKCLKQKQ